MSSEIDWGKEAGGLVEDGTYRVRINDYEEVKASTGTDQIRWHAEIIEGPHTGRTLIDHTPLTQKSLWRLATLVQACGIDTSKLGKMVLKSNEFYKVLDLCKHRTTYWDVFTDTHNGKKSNKVQGYFHDANNDVLDPAEVDVGDPACPF